MSRKFLGSYFVSVVFISFYFKYQLNMQFAHKHMHQYCLVMLNIV